MTSVGDIVAGYKLVAPLGEGGFGKAFLVETGTGKKKVMKIPLDDRVEDLRREAAAHKRLKHPNIIEVEHIDAENTPPYILMEYFDGKPLSDPGLQLYVGQAVWILKECLSALEYAHQQGVIHRDIKPSNIMCCAGADEFPTRILDFGLAKIRKKENALEMSMSGYKSVAASSGTEAYMSPEQRRGEELTPASDIHSLGQVIFECFAGRRIEPGENVAKTLSKTKGMNEKYMRVLEKMLEPDIKDRYKSAQEALDDLGATHLFETPKKYEVDVSHLICYYSGLLEDETKRDVLSVVDDVKVLLKGLALDASEWTRMTDEICRISDGDPTICEIRKQSKVLCDVLKEYKTVNGRNLTSKEFEFFVENCSGLEESDRETMDKTAKDLELIFNTFDYKIPEEKAPQESVAVEGKPADSEEAKTGKSSRSLVDCLTQIPKVFLFSVPAYLFGVKGCIPDEVFIGQYQNTQKFLASLASGAGLYAGKSGKWFGPTLALGASFIPDVFLFANDLDKGFAWAGGKTVVFGASYLIGRLIS